ncbi:MAG: hypothetical protein KC550_03620, partial [Nanoarchaeota archaeon]|nr:hypothetical protein [Nanoarchaeota archaeon]
MKRLKFVLFLFLLVFSFFIVYSGSIDLNKTIVGDGNISLGDEIQFSLYVENNDVYNITNETFIFSDIYDFNYLNYTWSSENLSNFGFGNISWELNIPSFTNRTIYVNFTALQNGSNLENYFELRNNSILIDDDSVYFNISNLNGNITPAILNVSIVKTLLNEGNISVNDTLEFEINISNVGEVNITSFDYTFIDIFNYNYLNYTSSSLVINNSGLGNLSWKFDLNTNSSLSLYVNFTALQNGSNLINYFELRNISGNTLGFDNVLFNISNSSGNSSFPILN